MEPNNQNNPVLNQEPMMQYHSGEPQALPMMGFWESVRTCFRKYFDFKGRARRSEYWWYGLFCVVACLIWALFGTLLLALPIGMAVQHVSGNETAGMTTMVIILCIPLLFLVLPSFSVQVRRLHDTGRSGWWVVASVILEIAASALPFILFGWDASDFDFTEEFSRSFELSTVAGVADVVLSIATNVLSITLVVFSVFDSHKTENKYGPSPKYQQETNVCLES